MSLASLSAKAQTADAVIYSIAATFQYNSIWTERGSLQPFTQNHPWAMQIDWGILKNTKKAWAYCNCYSQNGLSISYINFANPSQLGRAFTFSVYAEPYLFRRERLLLSLRGSAGLAFLNKVYDSTTNKENIFFSTGMSFLLGLGLNFSYRINDRYRLKIGTRFNHISNGGRKDPNEGMNFPGFSVGLEYQTQSYNLEKRVKEPFTKKSLGIMLQPFGTQRTAWADGAWPQEQRLLLGLNAGLLKRIGRMNAIGPGGEVYYDGINRVVGQRRGQALQTILGAVNIQHYLFFGKLLFGQQLAWYITPNTGFEKNLFQRYILEYELKRNWFGGITLKAHGDHSDYIAISTGYFLGI